MRTAMCKDVVTAMNGLLVDCVRLIANMRCAGAVRGIQSVDVGLGVRGMALGGGAINKWGAITGFLFKGRALTPQALEGLIKPPLSAPPPAIPPIALPPSTDYSTDANCPAPD